ncbi:MAG: glycosyltransferase family 39 protein, partial [Candidatus Pacebacteria bacterium]|nr:glycosyltransferase family 39 protein [Candidatus Paceibacterota bacterium]
HIPAGYTYDKFFDYRLNPEHPPLVKMLSGIPLLTQNLKFPAESSAWQTDINGQWAAGSQFLYESGNDANQIIFLARIFPILITILLVIAVYFCGKEILGKWWALLPSLFIALSPNFLAHGHYVTTDVGAALGIFLSVFAFANFLTHPSKNNMLIAGLAFGLAQLIKFSAALLIPFFILLISIFYIHSVIRDINQTQPSARLKRFGIRFFRYFRATFIVFVVGYILVFLVYAVATWNYPVSKQVADIQAQVGNFNPHILVDATIWMAKTKVLKPFAEYSLGVIMVLQRSAGGNNAYFLGQLSSKGWWYYFPLIYLMKESLPILMVVFSALLLTLGDIFNNFKKGIKYASGKLNEYLNISFMEFSMLLFVIIYWAYSMKSPLNIGFRHLMPSLPFIYILSVKAVKKWITVLPQITPANYSDKLLFYIKWLKDASIKAIILFTLIIWFIITPLAIYPNFLSRYNELFGGTYNGHKYATDSNFDWGQDLNRLEKWVEENNIQKIAVDYFGGGSPKYSLGDKFEPWWSAKGNPKEIGIEWLAISVNSLRGSLATPVSGFNQNPEDKYSWLENPLSPTARAGASIFIYKL